MYLACKGLKNEVELICSCISSVCTQAGLGKPPKSFTTNGNESLNSILKRRANLKQSEWPQFNNNKVMKASVVEEQQLEFEKAVFGKGEYELSAEFKHLEISHLSWIQMTPDQCKTRIDKACKARLYFPAESLSSNAESLEKSRGPDMHIGVKFDDAKVEHVSIERLSDMRQKAEELLSTPNLVLPCPGAIVSSLSSFKAGSNDPPHLVITQKWNNGKEVKCDCPVYRSSPNICQHAIAAAENMDIISEYLHWVHKTKEKC